MKITIQVESKQYGPYSPLELKTMVNEGTISGNELAWHEGMSEWKVLKEMVDLETGSLLATSPPPISRHSGKKFTKNTRALIMVGAPLALAGIIAIIFMFVARDGSDKDTRGDSDQITGGDIDQIAVSEGNYKDPDETSFVVSKSNLKGIEKVLTGYLSATSVRERSEYVVDGPEILPRMIDRYSSGVRPAKLTETGEASPGYESGGVKYFSALISWEGRNSFGRDSSWTSRFWFQERNGELLVDWMASLGKNKVTLGEAKKSRDSPLGPFRMRLEMKLAEYYNYEFRALKDTHLSLSFNGGHAHVARDSPLGKKFEEYLVYDTAREVTVLMRHLRGTYWVIDDLVREDWAPETEFEKRRRGALATMRKAHHDFALSQMTIEEVINSVDSTVSFLVAKKAFFETEVYGEKEPKLKIFDYKPKGGIGIVPASEDVKKQIMAVLDGSDNQDQDPVGLLVSKTEIPRSISGSVPALLVHELLFTGHLTETATEKEERIARQAELTEELAKVFGDSRDEKVKLLRTGKKYMLKNFALAKDGTDVEYKKALDVLVAIWIAGGGKIPGSITEQKSLIKSVLGTPDRSTTGVFNKGNFLQWGFFGVVENEDTEEVTENVDIVFAGTDLLINVSGPNGLGDVGGGIRDPRGILTQEYKSVSGLWQLYSTIIDGFFN